jgi:chorismate mutase
MLKTAMGYISQAFTDLDRGGLDTALAQLTERKLELQANVGRLRDLQRSAVSEQKSRKIVEKMRNSGFEADFPKPLYHAENRLVGWQLRAKKSP